MNHVFRRMTWHLDITTFIHWLEGVKPDLLNVVKETIELTTVDFGVIEGVT